MMLQVLQVITCRSQYDGSLMDPSKSKTFVPFDRFESDVVYPKFNHSDVLFRCYNYDSLAGRAICPLTRFTIMLTRLLIIRN
jgi:hypothetical protein